MNDAKSHPVALTTYGKIFAYSNVRNTYDSYGAMSVDAGQTIHNYLYLNRYFDMSVAGTYTVTVQRNFRRLDGKGVVLETAGAITVTTYPMTDQDVAREVMGHAVPTP